MSTVFTAENALIKKNGRGTVKDGRFPMFTTGSGVEFNIKAAYAYAEIEAGFDLYEPWVSVLIDGVRLIRMPLAKGKNRIMLFNTMNPDVVKHVRITKDTQSMPEDPEHFAVFNCIETDGELVEQQKKGLNIEFIGDSVTSGEGLLGSKEKLVDWISLCFDSVTNYTNLVATALNADYRVISQSGWGVGSAWNNDPNCALSKIYKKICGTNKALKDSFDSLDDYDFSWKPDVIVVNLGTNDSGGLDQPEFTDPVTGEKFKNYRNPDGSVEEKTRERFKKNTLAFLKMIRECNPGARIIWAYGILGNTFEDTVKEAINEFSAANNDKAIIYHHFSQMTEEQTGARWHPGALAHKMMADELCELIG